MKTGLLVTLIAAAVLAIALFIWSNPNGPSPSPGAASSTSAITAGEQQVYVYFLKTGESEKDCAAVFALPRQVDSTPAVVRAALAALLTGPTAAEKSEGYYSNLNPGTAILGLTVEDGVATVNFDSALDRNVGGSCRVTGIRAEIASTLKQFPNVQTVIISVEGRTDEALQP